MNALESVAGLITTIFNVIVFLLSNWVITIGVVGAIIVGLYVAFEYFFDNGEAKTSLF